MKIQNAMIKNVTDGLNEEGMLAVMFDLEGQSTEISHSFKLADIIDVLQLTALMRNTNSHEVGDLDGKIVRIATDSNDLLWGIGAPIKDLFVLVNFNNIVECGESHLEQVIKGL